MGQDRKVLGCEFEKVNSFAIEHCSARQNFCEGLFAASGIAIIINFRLPTGTTLVTMLPDSFA
jgi:hypothetical protein